MVGGGPAGEKTQSWITINLHIIESFNFSLGAILRARPAPKKKLSEVEVDKKLIGSAAGEGSEQHAGGPQVPAESYSLVEHGWPSSRRIRPSQIQLTSRDDSALTTTSMSVVFGSLFCMSGFVAAALSSPVFLWMYTEGWREPKMES